MRVQFLAVFAVMIGLAAAAAADVEIISSHRQVIVDMSNGGDSDMTLDLGPWEGIVEDEGAYSSHASSLQDSNLTTVSMIGYGFVEGGCIYGGWYEATSEIVVAYDLLAARHCSLQGVLTGYHDTLLPIGQAEVSLVGPGGTILQFATSNTESIDTSAPLPAGGPYTLEVRAHTAGAAPVWWYSPSGYASFDLTFTLTPLAVWVGEPGGSWFDPENWDGGVLPSAQDAVVLDVEVLVDGPGAVAASLTLGNGGTLLFASGGLAMDVEIQAGGSLAGNGEITGNVVNAGTLSGDGPLSIAGDYDQIEDGVLHREISYFSGNGDEPAFFTVSGTATLDGTLHIDLEGGCEPPIGASYTLLEAGAVLGEFDAVVFGEDSDLVITVGPTSVVATVVPNISGAAAEVIIDGFASNDRLGNAVAGIGDVDGDGIPDFAVGAYLKTVGGLPERGRVYIYSGADASMLWSAKGASAGDQFGFAVAGAGDVNGDGTPDVLAGAPGYDDGAEIDNGRAYVLDGTDGSVIWTFTGGADGDFAGGAVAGIGEVNGDGYSDVMVGAWGKQDEKGRTYVLSGVNGAILYWDTGSAAGDRLGYAVAGVGDVDADGTPDFAAGAYRADNASGTDAGAVWVYSGADGSLLHEFSGEAGDFLGIDVDAAGDLDGDGHADVIVGAMFAGGSGKAYVFSGIDGALLRTFAGEADADQFGRMVTTVGDVDGDGTSDIGIGAPNHDGAGHAYIFSGADSVALYHLWGESDSDMFALSLDGIGDIDGNGLSDVVVGARMHDAVAPDAGRAYVFLTVAASFVDLNGDGIVDGADLGRLLGAWGACDSCPEDLNADGMVDGSDLGILLANWGPCPE